MFESADVIGAAGAGELGSGAPRSAGLRLPLPPPMLALIQLSNYLISNFEELVLGCIEANFCK